MYKRFVTSKWCHKSFCPFDGGQRLSAGNLFDFSCKLLDKCAHDNQNHDLTSVFDMHIFFFPNRFTGPDFFVRKVADYLVSRGYPEDVIVKL